MKKAALFMLLALSAAANAVADDICAGDWQGDSEFVKVSASDNEFLVAEKCKKTPLARETAKPRIALGYTTPMPVEAKPDVAAVKQPEPEAVKPQPEAGAAAETVAEVKPLNLGKVHFAFGSARLTKKGARELKSIVASAKEVSVDVTGYTCDIGGKKVNQKLAKRRAATVASHLRRAGIKVATVHAKGKCCYEDSAPSKRAANRRAVVTGHNTSRKGAK